jgi:hypothetical protein
MITLASDCLLFELAGGESVPFSAEMLSVEVLGDSARGVDAEFVRQAAKAVFHYFKHDLSRQSVTVGEFAAALEKALRGLKRQAVASPEAAPAGQVLESDLCRLALESGEGRELFFFPRLRDELHHQLQHQPRILRFHGLRGCVMQLVGSRRWTPRCRHLEEQVVAYLRQCLRAETRPESVSLVVE